MKKGVINIISLLLVILMVLAVASGMYFWFSKIQSESQQTTIEYSEETLGNVLTEITIVDEVVYNTLAEDIVCLPATLTMTIQNTGANNIDISNNSDIIVSDSNGPLCLSTFTGTCISPEDRLYATKQNGLATNANITYSTDGLSWVTADDSVGTLELLSSMEFNEKLYFGGFYTNPDVIKGAQVFKSCDFESWTVDTSIPDAERIYALETFNGALYAGTSGMVSSNNGNIYKLETNATWSIVNDTGEDEVRALEVFDGKIYAGISFDENLSMSSDGITWEIANRSLGNITALITFDGKLYAGLDGGDSDDAKIWRSSNGTDFGAAAVKSTGDDAITAFEVFGDYIYAGTNKTRAASIFRSSDGETWTEVYQAEGNSDNSSINDFAVFGDMIYAVISNSSYSGGSGALIDASGGAILRSSDGITWTEVNNDSEGGFLSIINYTYCAKEKVSCVRGCDTKMVPGETRTIELQLSNTDCDMSSFGTSTDYSFRINFGSSASVSGRFGKEVESSTSNAMCEYTYPLCNGVGNCAGGTCTTAPLAEGCICLPAMPCEAVDPFLFDCSIGTGCGGDVCTLQAGEGRCACE